MELDTAGDGFFARFGGPARAIRCAVAIRETVRDLGLEVRLGVHAGECEVLDGKVAGIAVAIGARFPRGGPGRDEHPSAAQPTSIASALPGTPPTTLIPSWRRRNADGGRVAMPSITGGHHIAFTVSDADRSAEWYCSLLNMQVALQGDSEDVKFRVLAHPESGWVLGVRQYPTHHADGFDEFRTGLDHFAFGVASRAELEQWQKELSSRGITFTPITETPIGWVIVFRDPDNIQLEFWLPAA